MRDVRYAVRGLGRSPGFAAAVVLTVGLGIGATTAIFTVVNGVILRPLPFAHPERLVQVFGSSPVQPRGDAVSNLGEYRRQSTLFETFVGYEVSARYLRDAVGAERVMAVRAERGFFTMLGVAPIAGRTFGEGDPITLAVISEDFWRRRFGGDASAIGRVVTLDDQLFTIAGVMPRAFQFPYGAATLLQGAGSEARTDLWIPVEVRSGRVGHVTGRLKPNVSPRAAEAELVAIAKRLEEGDPQRNRGRSVYLEPLAEAVVAPSVRRPLFMLFAAVAIVLGLVSANVTNLSLVRATLRRRELAVRAALGAGRVRLVGQFLVESVMLALAGGALGLGVAWWAAGGLMRLAATHVPRAHEVGIDWRVFVFSFGTAALTGIIVALAPAISAMRTDPNTALQESGARSTMSASQRYLRDSLVVAEVALAFVLAMGAGILIREVVRLRHADAGMVTTNVMTVHVGRRMTSQADGRRYYDVADRVAALPGVEAAGFTQLLPLQNWGWWSNSSEFTIRGRPAPPAPEFPIELRFVTPGYFQALGIPVRGRAFAASDDAQAPRVILINETLARRSFAGEDPIGIETTRGTIVGVVGDVRQVHLDRPAVPEIFYAIAQNWSQVSELGMTLVVKTRGPAEAAVDAIRSAIRDVDPGLAVFSAKTMDRVIRESLADLTLFLMLMAAFAGVALVLAATGTYAVISYIATSRTREFAIRYAVGADAARVIRLVLGRGAILTALGLAVGLTLAIGASPLLSRLPMSVRPPDVATTLPVVLAIAAVSLVACIAPAARAARVNPMTLLRDE